MIVSLAYEAGRCGYGLYQKTTATGHDWQVVAPILISRKAGDRGKADHCDAGSVARRDRGGELTAVWVSGRDQGAVRDLTRARGDTEGNGGQYPRRVDAWGPSCCVMAESVTGSPGGRRHIFAG